MGKKEKLKKFLYSEKAVWLLVAAALAGRLVMFFSLGSGALNHSDDVAYVQSGIVFAQTGVISVWSPLPTAKIMPGMPVVAGLLSMVFGEGAAYIDSIRLLWIALGCATVYVFYRCCLFHMSAPCALFAAAGFLLPNWAWSDNSVLTEAPYLFFYMLCLLFVFRLASEEGDEGKNSLGFALSFMGALMFRANILIFLPFAACYILMMGKRKFLSLVRPGLYLAAAMLIFVIPWSVRNYRLFGEFIPITSGSANPTLLGTYQGESAPADDTLDYENNVYKVVRAQYPEAFNADGTLADHADGEKITEKIERLKTKYRLKVWIERDPLGFIWDYFFSKPACMLNWVWIWLPAPGLYLTLRFISRLNLLLCVCSAALSGFLRKKRDIMLWLGGTYVLNIYILAMSFASERYAAMFVPLRYMITGIGLYLALELISERRATHAAADSSR